MAKINLLPWRDELRKQKQQDFVAAIFATMLTTCLLFILAYLYVEDLKKHQQLRNKMLQDEIQLVDQKIVEIKDIENKKDQLLTKIEVIHQLQESRPQIVHLFDELAKSTPEGVFLTKFKQSGDVLSLTGNSQSNARVSAYMRGIEKSDWLQSPVLQEIKLKGKGTNKQKNNFSLTAKQTIRSSIESEVK